MVNNLFREGNIYFIVSINEIKDRDLCERILGDTSDIYFINNPKLQRFPYNCLTPKCMINYVLKKTQKKLTFNNILELLEIDDYTERFERPWKYLGNNKWICSAALGLAEGKKYFCLPWMRTCVMDYQEYRNNQIFQAIKKINGKIIFPVEGLIDNRFIDDRDICIKYLDEIL